MWYNGNFAAPAIKGNRWRGDEKREVAEIRHLVVLN